MSLVYSTGPMENAIGPDDTSSATAWTKVLNNHEYKAITAKIKVFRLNGTKTLIDTARLTVNPLSSAFNVSDVSGAFEFEVQVAVSPTKDADDVLIGVFGKDAAGNLNPSHRVVHEELTRIDELTPIDDVAVGAAPQTRPVT